MRGHAPTVSASTDGALGCVCVAHVCHSRAVPAHLGRFHSLRCPDKGHDEPRGFSQAYCDESGDLANLRGGVYQIIEYNDLIDTTPDPPPSLVITRVTCSACA